MPDFLYSITQRGTPVLLTSALSDAAGAPLAGSGAAGSSAEVARADHAHPRPSLAELGAAAAAHAHDFAALTARPTTLAGYGITDAPTKTGAGASGTWGISITGDAATLGGLGLAGGSAAPGANKVVRTQANGYTYLYYVNSSTPDSENPAIGQLVVTNGTDSFYRKASLAHLNASISPAWANVTGKPTTLQDYGISNALRTDIGGTIYGSLYTSGNLQVAGGYVNVGGKLAMRSTDTYLRLNQNASDQQEYANGVYTPGKFRADGGIEAYGGIWATAGNISAYNGSMYSAGASGGYEFRDRDLDGARAFLWYSSQKIARFYTNLVGDAIRVWESGIARFLYNVGFGVDPQPSFRVCIDSQGTTSATWPLVCRTSGGSNLMYVRSDGYSWVNQNWTTSDGRMKENIEDLQAPLEAILALRPRSFTWREQPGRGRHLGLIAQEAVAVVPEAFTLAVHPPRYQPGQRLPVGATEQPAMYTADYSMFVAPLIGAVQELTRETRAGRAELAHQIDELAAEVAALRAKAAWPQRSPR